MAPTLVSNHTQVDFSGQEIISRPRPTYHTPPLSHTRNKRGRTQCRKGDGRTRTDTDALRNHARQTHSHLVLAGPALALLAAVGRLVPRLLRHGLQRGAGVGLGLLSPGEGDVGLTVCGVGEARVKGDRGGWEQGGRENLFLATVNIVRWNRFY